MKTYWLVAPLFVASMVLASCNFGGQNAQNNSEADASNKDSSAMAEGAGYCKSEGGVCCKMMLGTYTATLPCADCGGIATTLVLKEDGNFTMTQVYEGKDDKGKTNYEGTVAVDKEKNLITLTAASGEVFYFTRYNGNLLLISADEAQLLPQYTENEMTPNYTFTKVEATEATPAE